MSAAKIRTLGPYAITASLGEGGYSKVKLGVHITTGEKVALKVLKNFSKMDKSGLKQLEREYNALSQLDHENVLKMKEYLVDVPYKAADGRETAVSVFVLELAPNGELFDFISHTGAFEENVARTFFHQLIAGLEHCHGKGVYHRDIKPENLLLGSDYVLKIADFGLSNAIQSARGGENLMHTICGTTYYQAPELVASSKGYDPAPVDIWACGVVLFVLLCRSPPYESTKMSDWYYNKLATNKHALFWRAHCRVAYFSDQSKDFINKILHPDPTKRLTIADMKKHPWWSGPTVTKESLQSELATRMKVVSSIKESAREQKGAIQVDDGDVVRGEGGVGDDELPAALPSFAIESAFYKSPVHAPLSDEPAFSEDDFKKKWLVKEIPAGIERYTRFRAKAGLEPGLILSRLVEVLVVKKCKYSIANDDSARLNVEVGPANFAVELFVDPESKSQSPEYIVDFRRKVGADLLFRAAYADLRASLGDVVAQPAAASVEAA